MAKKTYHGSCRCKRITFEVDLDLSADGTGKCNCTYCGKARWWGARATPETFRMLTGGEALGFGFDRERFWMRGVCQQCWITPLNWGHIPEIGGNYVSINVACLDDLDPVELLAAPVRYMDGLHDNWWNPPSETRHL